MWVIDTFTGLTVAFLRFEADVQEIFAVQVVPGRRFPDLVNDDRALLADSFVLPGDALADVPTPFRHPSRPTGLCENAPPARLPGLGIWRLIV